MLGALVEFRNAVAHDAPLLRAQHGQMLHVKRGRVKVAHKDAPFGGYYPVLAVQSMPLGLEHALRAVSTHDQLVAHFRSKASPAFWSEFMSSFGPVRTSSLNITALGGPVWAEAEDRGHRWQQILEWDAAIPLVDRESHVRDVLRRSVVKAAGGSAGTTDANEES